MTLLTRKAATTNGRRLSYLVGGSGAPVLFLHGVPGSALAWAAVLEQLPGGDHSVIVPDLLGFGESEVADGIDALGVQAQATAVIALLEELGGAAATVVTHDFGGPVALQMYAERPDLFRGLVLSSTNAFPDTPVPFPLSTIFWPIVGPMAARAIFSPLSLTMLLRVGAGAPKPTLARSSYVGGTDQARTIRTIFEHSLRNLREVYGPLEAVLANIDVPTAVLWGDRDPFFSVAHGRRTADAISGASLTVLPGAGHFLPAERPEAYVAAIESLRSAPSKAS